MKKRLLFIFVVCIGILTLTGCGKKQSVVGTWEWSEDGVSATYILNEDGTGSYTLFDGEESETVELTYEVEKNMLLITYNNDSSAVYELPFTFKDNALAIEDSNEDVLMYYKK